MKKIVKAPRFLRVDRDLVTLDEPRLTFDPEATSSLDSGTVYAKYHFKELREADYKPGFRMATLPEAANIVCASYREANPSPSELVGESYRYKDEEKGNLAKKLIGTSTGVNILGNTILVYGRNGLFVQDNPKFENGRFVQSIKSLEDQLGSHEENGVTFSTDRSIRFFPYSKGRGVIDFSVEGNGFPSYFLRNPVAVALLGGSENTEKFAQLYGNLEEDRNLLKVRGGIPNFVTGRITEKDIFKFAPKDISYLIGLPSLRREMFRYELSTSGGVSGVDSITFPVKEE